MPAAFTELDWYETPRFYDLIFDQDTETEVDFLEGAYARHASGATGRRRPPSAYEPACGSGRLVAALARRGWRVSGADLSQSMLAYAGAGGARAGLEATLVEGDMAQHRPRGRFDLAHCLVSTFKYLASEADARSHLECVAGALRPGGIYVLGFHLTDYARRTRSRERWVAEEDGTRVVCNIQGWPADARARSERVRSRLVVTEAGAQRRSETSWTFRTYDARQTRALLRSVPALEHVATYDFHYDLEEPRVLGDEQLDTILILRRAR